jgi:hypothetical protein
MFKPNTSFIITGVGSPTTVPQATCTGVLGFMFKISSIFYFQKITSMHECRLFKEMPGMCAKQRDHFQHLL